MFKLLSLNKRHVFLNDTHSISNLETFMQTKRKSVRSLCTDVSQNLDICTPDDSWVCFKNVISGESFRSYGISRDIKR